MRLPVLLLVAFMVLPAPANASGAWMPDLAGLAAVPQVAVPVSVVQKGLLTAAQRKGLPLQFAVPVAMRLGLSDGIWDEADAETARWRLKLYSPGAYSLHVHFSRLRLPPGAELRFYDTQGQRVQEPLTHANETADGKLATALVPGDTAVLELRVAKARRTLVQLSVSEVFHGYTDIRNPGKAGSIAKAGACERDVACPEGNAWRDQIRSAVRLQSGQFLCSGQLINNTSLDETPFLLTANHCGISSDNASTVVAYFNFQRPSCGGGSGSLNQTSSGSVFRRSDSNSDSTLISLISKPPAAYGVYYSGWDASGSAVTSGAGIHHPQGDEKSISLYSSAAQKEDDVCAASAADGGCDLVVDAWLVTWSSGATEQGSSGSGLWNQSKQLVGVLSGGASDCAGASGNGEPDAYGRFEVAWTTGSFKSDLDSMNTGVTSLEGICAGGAATCGSAPPPDGSDGGAAYGGSGSAGLLFSCLGLLAALVRHRRQVR